MKEVEVTKKLVELFFQYLKGENYTEEENKIKFDFYLNRKFRCETERCFLYKLPNDYALTHKTDIAIVNEEDLYVLNPTKNFVCFEVKHESSVTDQFKSRSYDIQHLKSNYPNCYGVMLYIKGISGISPEHAEKICYHHDYFFSTTFDKLSIDSIKPILEKTTKFLVD